MTMSHYDASGNEVKRANFRASDDDVVYDLGMVADHGLTPDFDKSDFDGKLVKVGGIDGPEDFQLGPVYFVLLKRMVATHDKPDAGPDEDYYGVMFAATAQPVTRTLQMATMGALPFFAVPRLVPSRSKPGYEYWRFDIPTKDELAALAAPPSMATSALPKGGRRTAV